MCIFYGVSLASFELAKEISNTFISKLFQTAML